ncbi:MAG: hypothetical protein DRJ59_05955 [Thermoprotei archaeon]|nr:MAG: hypothetical protein DRJ59_05955 [Thermoprotei archaeon]
MRWLILVGILVLLVLLAFAQPVQRLESGEEYSFDVGEELERYALTFEFVLEKYSAFMESFKVDLGGGLTVEVYSCVPPRPSPGVYLRVGGVEEEAPVLLIPGERYRFVVSCDGSSTEVRVEALEEGWVLRSETVQPFFIQGLTYGDGKWYYTATSMVFRVSERGEVEDYNDYPIPGELGEKGYFHLGDPDYYKGLIVIPIEKKGYVRPAIIAIYDADSLKLVRYAYVDQDHAPWVAVDPEGYVYCSEFQATEIYVYRLDDIGKGNKASPVRVVELKGKLPGVQGAVYVDGFLYASVVDWYVYRVNLETGNVERLIPLPKMYEVEGIEYAETPDGALHVLMNTFSEKYNLVYHAFKVKEGEVLAGIKLDSAYSIGPKVVIKARQPLEIAQPRIERVKEEIPVEILTVATLVVVIIAALLAKKLKKT